MPSRRLYSAPVCMVTDADNPCAGFEQSSLAFYQALLADDKKAWECLYASAFRSFVPYARQRSSIAMDDALDILQEGMAEFALKLNNGRYAFQGKPVTAYVFTVCRNQWVSFLRKNHRQKTDTIRGAGADEADSVGDTEDSYYSFSVDSYADPYRDEEREITSAERESVQEDSEVDWRAVGKAFADVGKDCQTMLHCFYVEEKSLGECGTRIGLQENSAKVKRFRCAQRLKALYIQYKTA